MKNLSMIDFKRLPRPLQESYWRRPSRERNEQINIVNSQSSRPQRICEECYLEMKDRKHWRHYADAGAGQYLRIDGMVVCFDHLGQEREAIQIALKERAMHSSDWDFMHHAYWKIFYTFKAIICILLQLKCCKKTKSSHWIDSIASWNVSCFEGEYSWTELQVGRGVFKRWFYRIESM
jgi:hypothetical protein